MFFSIEIEKINFAEKTCNILLSRKLIDTKSEYAKSNFSKTFFTKELFSVKVVVLQFLWNNYIKEYFAKYTSLIWEG